MVGIWREDETGDIVRVPVVVIRNPKVGIFWIIETEHTEDIIYDAVLVSQGEKYGDAIQHAGHYEFWENLKSKSPAEVLFNGRSYDAYPRGRIVFFPAKKRFILYADRCISTDDLGRVLNTFEIDESDFAIKDDEHYRCAQCNPFFYVDIKGQRNGHLPASKE
jgi:hypothetical protein